MRTRSVSLFAVIIVCAVASQFAQTPAKRSFEVVSIRPTEPGQRGGGGGIRGDRYTMAGTSLRGLLLTAYQVLSSPSGVSAPLEIIGVPPWADSDRYDVQAIADCSGGGIPREQMQLMVRSLLEERFQLKAHMETRDQPVYNLTVARDGLKIKRSEDQTPVSRGPVAQLCGALPPPAPTPGTPFPPPGQRGSPFDPDSPAPRGFMGGMFSQRSAMLRGSAVPLSNMIGMMQSQVGRPIIDKTDLNGLYDFILRFAPEGATPLGAPSPAPGAAPGAPGGLVAPELSLPSIFTALEEMGLRLESARGPIEVLVVDSVNKPSEN